MIKSSQVKVKSSARVCVCACVCVRACYACCELHRHKQVWHTHTHTHVISLLSLSFLSQVLSHAFTMLPPVRLQSRSPRRRSSETHAGTDLASGFPVSWSKDNPAWQNVGIKNWYTVPSSNGVTKISLGSVEFMPNSLQGPGPAPSSAVTLLHGADGGKGGTDGGKGGKQMGPSDADGGAGKGGTDGGTGGKHTGTSQAPPAPQTTASTATAASSGSSRPADYCKDFWVKSYLTVPTSLVPQRVTWGELEHLPVQPAGELPPASSNPASDSRTNLA